ncbi:MAG TPA: M1 family metallopeptidase [Myxococcaceae bacterium]|nr:M1 family metallopeptidase [Myxococcaceae bacterium]
MAGVLILGSACLLGLSCTASQAHVRGTAPEPPSAAKPAAPVDAQSYADPAQVRLEHLVLKLAVDFDARSLQGEAALNLAWQAEAPGARELVLDTRDLEISEVASRPDRDAPWEEVPFTLEAADAVLGSALRVQLPGPHAQVRVRYRTSPHASGLQWLTPEMTESGQPFLFSQSQAIHARSWVPLQDTPSVRFTYEAEVVPPEGLTALMSAERLVQEDGRTGTSQAFRMEQPIPSYLMALAVGALEFAPVTERFGIWAEAPMLPRATQEFADTGEMIAAAESLYGPYRWGRYDLLVLPPSFPYGGMENPRLTFLTPTVIVGDRSLVGLVAHELAHSWSGNLVTNATWNDFWLNEGFTSYVELRILEAVYGPDFAAMEAVLSQEEALSTIEHLPAARQRLRLEPTPGQSPDTAVSHLVYDKGSWFLRFLESRYGREHFDPFLRAWFDTHAFQSVTTQQFVDFYRARLEPLVPGAVTAEELVEWLDGAGIPGFAEPVRSVRFEAVDAARKAWAGSGDVATLQQAAEGWTTLEWMRFLESLPAELPVQTLEALDAAFGFTGTSNGELAMRWYPLTVRSGYVQAQPELAAFTARVGRRKLIMPIYAALMAREDTRALGVEILERARAGYHPITTGSVERLIQRAQRGP